MRDDYRKSMNDLKEEFKKDILKILMYQKTQKKIYFLKNHGHLVIVVVIVKLFLF